MFKPETIRNFVKKANARIDYYMSVALLSIALCISKGNRKIGHVLNVSIMPLITCGNCAECMFLCYDLQSANFRPSVLDARARNTAILRRDRERYFALIRNAIERRRKNFYFRWHVGGEIPDYDYFCRMVEIARDYPHYTFWTYTKMYDIVNRYVWEHGRDRVTAIPENLNIMFSEWDGMPLLNPYGFKVFTVKLKAGNKNHAPEYFDSLYKCPGNCDICKALSRGCIGYEDTYADEH